MTGNASTGSVKTQAEFAYPNKTPLANLGAMTTLAERIRTTREAEGFSQESLGKLVGVSRQAIGQWERGETETLTTARVESLARVLQVAPAWLAFEVGTARGGSYGAPERSPIDVELLSAIVEIVSTILVRRKKTLPPRKLGLLIARIYEIEAGRHGKSIDEGNITSLLELTL